MSHKSLWDHCCPVLVLKTPCLDGQNTKPLKTMTWKPMFTSWLVLPLTFVSLFVTSLSHYPFAQENTNISFNRYWLIQRDTTFQVSLILLSIHAAAVSFLHFIMWLVLIKNVQGGKVWLLPGISMSVKHLFIAAAKAISSSYSDQNIHWDRFCLVGDGTFYMLLASGNLFVGCSSCSWTSFSQDLTECEMF